MIPSASAALALLLLSAVPALSQAATSSETPAVTADDGPAGIIPYKKGYNLSLGTTSQHDSSNGWSSLLTPDLAYRFDRHFSADVSALIYSYINVVVTGGTTARPTYTNSTKHFVTGDTTLNGHMQFNPSLFAYELIASVGLPTGNDKYGLGAGQATFNLNNHFEKDLGMFTPFVELGFGDSSALDETRVRKSYVTVGKLANFQAGTSIDLPRNASFSAAAYEELPTSRQTVYSTTGRGKKKVTTATTTGAAEDNGFQTNLDLPVNPHVTLSGFYNRSLRNHIDTAGFSFTFLLKAPPANAVR